MKDFNIKKSKFTDKFKEIKEIEKETGKKILCDCKDYKGISKAVKILKEVGFYERSFSTNS